MMVSCVLPFTYFYYYCSYSYWHHCCDRNALLMIGVLIPWDAAGAEPVPPPSPTLGLVRTDLVDARATKYRAVIIRKRVREADEGGGPCVRKKRRVFQHGGKQAGPPNKVKYHYIHASLQLLLCSSRPIRTHKHGRTHRVSGNVGRPLAALAPQPPLALPTVMQFNVTNKCNEGLLIVLPNHY